MNALNFIHGLNNNTNSMYLVLTTIYVSFSICVYKAPVV